MTDVIRARYLLVHSTDLDVPVESAEETVVTTPYDDLRKNLLVQNLVVEKKLLDHDGKLTEAAAIIQETWDTMKTTYCRSLIEWAAAMKLAKSLGHELFSCDDPKARSFGFVDHTANEVFFIGLTKFKEATAENWAESGMSWDDFKSAEGRTRMMEGDSIFESHWDEPTISDEERAHLKSLVNEICADIAREFAQEVPVLDDLLPRPDRATPWAC